MKKLLLILVLFAIGCNTGVNGESNYEESRITWDNCEVYNWLSGLTIYRIRIVSEDRSIAWGVMYDSLVSGEKDSILMPNVPIVISYFMENGDSGAYAEDSITPDREGTIVFGGPISPSAGFRFIRRYEIRESGLK